MQLDPTLNTPAYAPPAPAELPRRRNYCARITSGFSNCVKKVALGTAAAAVISPISLGMATLTAKLGLITDPSVANKLKDLPPQALAVFQAACPTHELAKQLNLGLHEMVSKAWELQLNEGLHPKIQPHPIVNATSCPGFPGPLPTITASQVKSLMVAVIVLGVVSEELMFRRGVPNGIDKTLTCVTRKKTGDLSFVNSKTAKVMRITLSASLFSIYHLQNAMIGMPTSAVQNQIVATFFAGLGLGILKETPAGLTGCITAHGIYDAVMIADKILGC